MVFVLRKKTAPKLSLRERSCGLHERSSGLSESLLGSVGAAPDVRGRFPPCHREPVVIEEEVVGDADGPAVEGDLIGAPLGAQLRSAAFAELTLIFATCALFYNLFLGSMCEQAQAALQRRQPHLAGSDAAALASAYVSTFLSASPLGALLNAPLGYCIDHLGFGPMLAVTLVAGAAHALALWLGYFFSAAGFFLLLTAAYFSYMYGYLAFKFGFDYIIAAEMPREP